MALHPISPRHRHALTAAAQRSRHGSTGRRPTPAQARRWLSADGSLTARLRGLGAVRVSRLRQGHQLLTPAEQTLLGLRHGHVREVLLWVDERPAVWARSVVSVQGVKGAWRALRGLGNRPLAELLFADRAVRRQPLSARPLKRHERGGAHLRQAWPGGRAAAPPTWLRWSVFTRRGQVLLVQEAFSPWVLCRPLPAARP
jgi:chorismate--pyruvate lyase